MVLIGNRLDDLTIQKGNCKLRRIGRERAMRLRSALVCSHHWSLYPIWSGPHASTRHQILCLPLFTSSFTEVPVPDCFSSSNKKFWKKRVTIFLHSFVVKCLFLGPTFSPALHQP